ncbi:TFIIA-alpha and beta-like factor isoform X1 [Astyanax mexicanus]|uniref:TFIIA-alpha and beta-like factor isoform X1 n=1 Tax=Astyanax mexicanus TaxID=7994 RepID=A0A8T2KKI5_ASTMX|nr:TFIIA-alpha and beta-like factor isoform X1 [Astyanax mexicanus]
MFSNSNTLPKLYLSVIDDVMENVRELFLEEGIEEQVLDDLRQRWESKVLQSKAVEGFSKDNTNPSNFVLQLPANYSQTLQKTIAPVVIPAGQLAQSFAAKGSTIATFSLPPGVTYPVHIPAGVTLQTASGHLYKVNVPVMVTKAPGCQRVSAQANQPVVEQSTVSSTIIHNIPAQVTGPCPQTLPVTQTSQPALPTHQQSQSQVPQPPSISLDQSTRPEAPATPEPSINQQYSQWPPESPSEFTLDGIEFSPQPLDMSMSSPLNTQLSTGLLGASGNAQVSEFGCSVQEMVERAVKAEEEPVALASSGDTMSLLPDLERTPDSAVKLEMELLRDYNFNELTNIVQMDGACDSSSEAGDEPQELEEESGAIGENEFLGMINAEALKALQGAGGSSDPSDSSSSNNDESDLKELEEEDPLNSGDDVSEQDIPEVFDTENVVVCQYDKIHRSKNRWKFYLKDGVMCYRGKDYVFSKAVGEAEWFCTGFGCCHDCSWSHIYMSDERLNRTQLQAHLTSVRIGKSKEVKGKQAT